MTSQEDKWLTQYNNWVEYYTILDRLPSQLSEDANERRVAHWQAYQRKLYKQGELSDARIKLLQGTRGWKWCDEDTWEKQRQMWIKQYSKLGKNPSTKSADPDEKVAGKWQSNQRHAYKNIIIIDEIHNNIPKWLTQDRITILEATPGWTWGLPENNDSENEEEEEEKEVRQDRKRARMG
jgi:hypothetical protein